MAEIHRTISSSAVAAAAHSPNADYNGLAPCTQPPFRTSAVATGSFEVSEPEWNMELGPEWNMESAQVWSVAWLAKIATCAVPL